MKRARRALAIAAALALVWLGGGALLHFVVFPEPAPAPGDLPERGDTVRLPRGSTFVYRQTAADGDGALFRAEWTGEPGAGVARHTHPSQEVRFRITHGVLRVEADAIEHRLEADHEVSIPAGVAHRWENPGPGVARGVFELRPAGRADFVFAQLDRAFGGDAGPVATAVQTFLLIGAHGEHTSWPVEALRFVLAPTVRLFGFRSYYPPDAS